MKNIIDKILDIAGDIFLMLGMILMIILVGIMIVFIIKVGLPIMFK